MAALVLIIFILTKFTAIFAPGYTAIAMRQNYDTQSGLSILRSQTTISQFFVSLPLYICPLILRKKTFKAGQQAILRHNGLTLFSADRKDDYSKSRGNGSGPETSENPLQSGVSGLENLTRRSTRVDGRPLKRRSPKPSNKPALTRKQELSRQAQRTHRDRKEFYIKALELELLQMKQNFSTLTIGRGGIAKGNQQLKQLLLQHGTTSSASEVDNFSDQDKDTYGLNTEISCSHSPHPLSLSNVPNIPTIESSLSLPVRGGSQGLLLNEMSDGLDYEQIGIDLVLKVERPCLDHMQYNPAGDLYCHALMAIGPAELDIGLNPEISLGLVKLPFVEDL